MIDRAAFLVRCARIGKSLELNPKQAREVGTALADIFYGVEDPTPIPEPTPAPLPLGPINAVYIGNKPEDLYQYEAWLGRNADAVQLHIGKADWTDAQTGWLSGVWKDIDRVKLWSIPLIPWSSVLSVAARGGYNQHYVKQAQDLLANSPGDDAINVRAAWEMNLEQPWHAKGQEELFAEALRQMITSYHGVSKRFVFEFCPDSQGDMATEMVEKCYPGDEFIGVIGTDIYHNDWNPQDPDEAFNDIKWRPCGLEWLKRFASAHNKPMAISEWGVKNPDSSDLIGLMFEWMRAHDCFYHTYWNDDGGYPGKLSFNRAPALSDAYRAEFGQ